MNRRNFLAGFTSAVVSTAAAGCGSNTETPSDSDNTTTDSDGGGNGSTDSEDDVDTTNADKTFEPRFGTVGSDSPMAAYETYFDQFDEGRERIAETVHPQSPLSRSAFVSAWSLEMVESASADVELVQENPSYRDIKNFVDFLEGNYSTFDRFTEDAYESVRKESQTALVSASVTMEASGDESHLLERTYEDSIKYGIVATHDGEWFLFDELKYYQSDN